MIGIYKITNKKNGFSYIGKSIDIERRFMEHKTPKARGNDLLHKDIQNDINSFTFEIIEECKKEELSDKEIYYIDLLKPEYNVIKKGRAFNEDFRKKVSESCKKWWANLPEETKNKIIKNNLKGPKEGHTVSNETRRKISNTLKENKVGKIKVKILETGKIFNSIGELERYLNACTGTCAAYWKGKIKTVKGLHIVKV